MTIRSSDRERQLGEFYAENASRLQRLVAAKARVQSHDVIEEACAGAWTILVRRRDVELDARGLGWLTVVATRLAWRLANTSEIPVGTFQSHDPGDDDRHEPADTLTPSAEEVALDRVQHVSDVEAFRRLKPREREALYLRSLGYRYNEIAELTGASYTAVNRRITEGRRRVRALATAGDDTG